MQLERKFLLLTSWTNQNCDHSLLKLKFKAVVHVWLLVRGAYPLTSLASVGTTRNHNECYRRLLTPYDTAFLEGCDYCMCQYPPLMTVFFLMFLCVFISAFCFVLFCLFILEELQRRNSSLQEQVRTMTQQLQQQKFNLEQLQELTTMLQESHRSEGREKMWAE